MPSAAARRARPPADLQPQARARVALSAFRVDGVDPELALGYVLSPSDAVLDAKDRGRPDAAAVSRPCHAKRLTGRDPREPFHVTMRVCKGAREPTGRLRVLRKPEVSTARLPHPLGTAQAGHSLARNWSALRVVVLPSSFASTRMSGRRSHPPARTRSGPAPRRRTPRRSFRTSARSVRRWAESRPRETASAPPPCTETQGHGERLRAILGLEAVVPLDRDPGQLAPLLGQLIAQPSELLLRLHELARFWGQVRGSSGRSTVRVRQRALQELSRPAESGPSSRRQGVSIEPASMAGAE